MGRVKARNGILSITPYVPGKPVEEVQKEYGLTDVVKMASNENPLKTSPKAMAAMRAELEKVYMYPEGSSPDLRAALALRHGLNPDQFMVGNGGDHVIAMITEAFVNEGDEVIMALPSFKTYELATIIIGGRIVGVPVDSESLTIDLEAMLAAITDRTKLIFLCNPNNPTGTIVRQREVDAFLDRVPERCLVVFDEAYREYAEAPDFPDGLDYVKRHKNVIVIRTFSKVYGLAGQRIGYAAAPQAIMDTLNRVLPPFPANRVAQAGALAALNDDDFLREVLRVNREGREYLEAEFSKLGMTYSESQANFIFVDLKHNAADLAEKLLKKGFILRPGGPWGYPSSFRVTIGTPEENKRFITALNALLN
ncbi:histidinol-phosphate transaminase [Deltaproteobacteria bacterium Smac51]|nr:histidinol-phosphate transaminase [Deltaproteobacteria bacterium Smac51]